jgi:pyruvate dehydrogenase E2 component (dihydrolipoamide acetyltransferase)
VVTAVPAATGGAEDNGEPGAPGGADAGSGPAVLAKPPVRKLARDLGIDLSRLSGTGPGGSITRDDVQAAASGEDAAGSAPATEPAAAPAAPFAAVTAVAREERIPIRGVRKHTAAAMVGSAFSAPHVTEFLQIDITETMAATGRLRNLREFSEVRVSPLLLVARALMVAVARHPMINSSWDEEAQEIVVRHYVNLGIAAATERGLIVPNIRDAHALSLPGLARALAQLTETARAGKATPADLRGGTITITNVGVFGVDTGTPILTPGEAAILAFGKVRDAPWVHGGQLAVRKVTTLALSFDHRIVDGDLGSAVLRDIGAMLEDPLRMLAWS